MINKLFNHIKKHKLVYGIGAFALVTILVVFSLQGNGLKFSSKLSGNINWSGASISEEKFGEEAGKKVDEKILDLGQNKWKAMSQQDKNKKLETIFRELGEKEWNSMTEEERNKIIDSIIKKLIKKYSLLEEGVAKMKTSDTGTVDPSGITTVTNSGLQGSDTVDPSDLKKAPPKQGNVTINTNIASGSYQINPCTSTTQCSTTKVGTGSGTVAKKFVLTAAPAPGKKYRILFDETTGYSKPKAIQFDLVANDNQTHTGKYVKTNTTATLKNTDTGTVNLNGVQSNCGTVIVEKVGKGVVYLWDGNDKTIVTMSYSDPNVYTNTCLPLGNYSVGGVEVPSENLKVKSITDANGENIQSKEQSSRSNKQKLNGGETIKFVVEFNSNENRSETLKRSDTGTFDSSSVKKAGSTVEFQKPDLNVDPSRIQAPNHLIPDILR